MKKKFRVLCALTLTLALALSTVVMASPSPSSSSVKTSTSTNKTSSAPSAFQAAIFQTMAAQNVSAFQAYAQMYAETMRAFAQLTGAYNVFAPASYEGGEVNYQWAVPGLADSTETVYAFRMNEDGTWEIAPVTVSNGYANFSMANYGMIALAKLVQETIDNNNRVIASMTLH